MSWDSLSLLAQSSLLDNYHRATLEGKIVIGILVVFSMFAWSVMASKAVQMGRARKLNTLFREEYRRQKSVIEIHERRVKVEGCPLFIVYVDGCSN
jgi:hypothetical protein